MRFRERGNPSQANRQAAIAWLSNVLKSELNQNDGIVYIKRIQALASFNKGISREKCMEYIEILADAGDLIIDEDAGIIRYAKNTSETKQIINYGKLFPDPNDLK